VTRVLVVSAEPVGAVMAGPAIRALELARVLASTCEVTLAAPAPSDVGDAPVTLLQASLIDFETLLDAVRRHDVVVAQQLPPQLLRYVARMPVRYVADLYNPLMIEVLEAVGAGSEGTPRRIAKSVLAQCTVADLVICASEKQRDLWLGGMGMAGLVDVERYRADPTFRSFVDVVPFGLPEREPERGAPVLKGVWPGIARDDRVLLWAGGVWRWLDALTPIRAVQRLREGGRPVHLVFLGTGRPALDDAVAVPTSAGEAVAFARERGLEGVSVHFNEGWVPYAEREAYLLEADLAVCAHHDHLEARFSFRTRVLDHFWAGLPSVVTGGDAMGDLIERRALGRAVDAQDDEAFAAACAGLLDDDAAHAAVAGRVREVAREFRWSRAAAPLVRFCAEQADRPRRKVPPGVLARATLGQYPDVLADLHDRGGLAEVARSVPRHLGRVLRHRA
jgi:glycosyltransferase involved in cell wall biosynthesis